MEKIASQLESLRKAGWEYSGGLYDIRCYKDISLEEAKKKLRELRIEVEEDNLMEVEEAI